MTEAEGGTEALRADALRILRAGVGAADPLEAVRRSLSVEDGVLRAGAAARLELAAGSRILLLAVGKAAAAMTSAAMERLGGRVSAACVTVPRQGAMAAPSSALLPPSATVWEAGHPVPDIGSLAAASEALALARQAGEGDVVLCLLSGGASAMWAAPAAGLTLGNLRSATESLLRSGAPIEAVNAVRKHLSGIAGGQLARAAGSARVVTLAVSDVVGVGPESIGSGPTLPDPTTYADALAVVRSFEIDLPGEVLHFLRAGAAGAVPETPKPGELPNVAGFEVLLAVRDAVAGAAAEAKRLGYEVRVLSSDLRGEAREAALGILAEVRRAGEPPGSRVALLWGGETTVTVRGEGRGGRNQELALAAAVGLSGQEGVVFASMGTDGRDGPTDAAGGIVDGSTLRRGLAEGLDARTHLHANDSYAYLRATGDLIVSGPTGTNVNDLGVALLLTPAGEAESA